MQDPIPAPAPYGERQHSLPRRVAGLVAGIVVRPLLVQLLERERMREFVMHHLSNKLSIQESSMLRGVPPDLDKIQGFEDCHWLFSSNKLNHGIIRRTFVEAAFLFRLIRQMGAPRVVELGRYKGGGTLLLAAAGAEYVLSLDNDELPGQDKYTRELEEALEHFGLRHRVENAIGDAFAWPCEPASFDLVFMDFATDGQGGQRVFEHWWPAVKPGKYLLMGDGKATPLLELAAFAGSLDIEKHGGTRVPNCPGAFVLFQKNV